MPPPTTDDVWNNTLTPELVEIPRPIYFVYFSQFPAMAPPVFTLPEVTSGRYVQLFFAG